MSIHYVQNASDAVSQSSAGSLAKAFTSSQPTCEKCAKRPVEYRLNGSESFQISAQCGDRPRVTESVRLEPGAFCDDCVVMVLQKKSDALYERERARWLYRQELNQQQATNTPRICSQCRRDSSELIYVRDKSGSAAYCQTCLYMELRNEALKTAVTAPTGSERCAAMLLVFSQTKQRAREVFEFIWG